MDRQNSTTSPLQRTLGWLKALLLTMGALLLGHTGTAQIPVTVTNPTNTTPNLLGSYPSLALALTDLNLVTAMSGPVTLTCTVGSSETSLPTGLTIGSATLNPVLSSTNTVTINKSGAGTVTLNAAIGTSTPGSAAPDGILKLTGADYITIDGLTFTDGNAANPATMEFGVALFKLGAGDGAHDNTIQNCIFNMQRINNATGGGPMVEGSVGINVVNSTATAATTALTPTNGGTDATNGTNSNNKFYTNTINSGNYGIVLSGFAAVTGVGPAPTATTFLGDINNDIGGTSIGQGNQILNFGGAPAATNPSAGVRANNQWSANIRFNNINSNNGGGVNHPSTLRGIFAQAGTSGNVTIGDNTVSVKSGATTSALTAIENSIGITAAANTVSITNNTITGCTYTTATSGVFTGIISTASAANVNISSNVLSSNATNATSGTTTMITNTGIATVSVVMSSNNINGWTWNAISSGAFTGINCANPGVACTIAINSNNFQAITYAISGTGAHTYINWTSGTSTTCNVNSNTFTNLNVNTTGSVTFLNRGTTSMTATGSLSVSSNSIVTGFNKGGAGGTVTFYTSGGGDSSPNGSTILENLNNFSNVTLTGATTVGGWNDSNGASSANGPTKTVTNNTFNSITGTTGAVTGILVNFSGPGTSVSSNTITNLSGGGAVIGINYGTSNGQATHTIASNIITNLSSTGGGVNAIQAGSASIVTLNVNNNTIRTLSTTFLAAQANGIISTAGQTENIFKNSICDVQSNNTTTNSVNGIGITAVTTVNIFNNRIADLRTPQSNSANPLNGILLNAPTTANVSYNTVLLNAVSTGLVFGSTAMFSATTTALTLRNNVFINNSTSNTTGLTVAYRRSTTTLTTYQAASNNNSFFAPNIFTDGTNTFTTLPTYKAFVASRDANSVSENTTFLSTACGNANFLKVDPGVATQLESGGAPVAGITDDFDGDARNVSTPDIGSDEGTFILLDVTGPTITYVPLANTASTANRIQAITVTDPSGVPIAGIGLPVIYYRKNLGGYVSNQCVSTGGSGYDCTIDNAPLGGVTTGDVVSWYVAAQDGAGTPNVSVSPAAGASGLTADPPAAATPPTTPNSYNIATAISGTINVGTAETYTSLTRNDAAGLFLFINNNVVTGNITIECTSDLLIEDGAVALNAFDSPFTITVKPNGAARAITGAIASNALIRTNGASRFTIDGSTSGGTDRSLTITNTSVTGPQVVRFSPVGAGSMTNNTLKNCIIRNGVNTSSAVVVADATGLAVNFTNITIQNNDIGVAYIAIFTNATVSAGNGAGLLITQNKLDNAGANAIRLVGVYVQGADGATVSSNTIGNFNGVDGETDTGIWLATGAVNTTVSGNTVSTIGLTVAGAFSVYGIRESSGAAASGNNITGNTVSSIVSNSSASIYGIATSSGGTTIQRNNITGVNNTNTGTFGAYGIDLTAGNNSVVKNNFVSGVTGDMTGGIAFSTTFGIFGIRIGAGTGHIVDNNSVNLFGARAGTPNSSLLTAAFGIVATTSTGMDVRNNIFANNMTGGTTSVANVAMNLPSSGTSGMALTLNNNSYYSGSTAGVNGAAHVGTTYSATAAGPATFAGLYPIAAFNAATTTPASGAAANLRAYTSILSGAGTNDNASAASSGAVPYATSTDLHITIAATELGTGATIGSVTNDIDGDTRPQGTNYDKGADEVVHGCVTASAGSPQTICTLGTTTGLGGNTPTPGVGTWTVIGGGTGTFAPNANDPNATFTHTGGTVTAVRWTIVQADCPTTFADVTITINQPPTTASAGGPQTICALGTTLGLGGNTPTSGTGSWSVVGGGTGTFNPNASDPNATFTHATGVGPVQLRWTISNPPCIDSFFDVFITINQPPTTASAGGPQTICALGTTTGLGGNTPTSGTGTWSVQGGGTGSFAPNANDPNATFTHLTGVGPVQLRWTISNPPCTDSFFDVFITITPATAWYQDSEPDGLGDPNVSLMACTQPPGYVADNSDLCPLVIGTVGSSCDDGNVFTANDVINGSCVCVGTPVPCDNWSLVINTDAAGADITWTMVEDGTANLLDAGGPYPNNATITEPICVPLNNCWDLNFFDSACNGITPGGWVLRDNNGKRVIDNSGNGGAYTCSATPFQAFCSPIGTDVMTLASCDKMNWLASEYIVANPNNAVSAQWMVGNQTDDGYQFWFYNPVGGYNRRILHNHATSMGYGPPSATRACHLPLTFSPFPLPANVFLNVRVRSLVNGVYSEFGPACRFIIDAAGAACPPAQLDNNPLHIGTTYSCGVTGKVVNASGYTGKIYALPVLSQPGNVVACKYKFTLSVPAEGYTRVVVVPSYALTLGPWLSTPLLCGTFTYDVTVQASFDCTTYCPAGPTCTVEITNPGGAIPCTAPFTGGGGNLNIATQDGGNLNLWPNPNRGDQLYVELSEVPEGVSEVTLDLYDIFGQRVMSRVIATDGGFSTVLDLEGSLADGLYMVNVTAGEKTYTQRLIIE